MRIAVLSDIHGNRTAFEAVLADLRAMSPDLVLHGGDLADSGASPCAIIDQILDLEWAGVYGNTDEMLFRPQSLEDFASTVPHLRGMFDKIGEMAAWTRNELGAERLDWIEQLPLSQIVSPVALVHASPESTWKIAEDSAYEALGQPLAVHGHIHVPGIRGRVVNCGSVGQPHDGDPRASYLLVDEGRPSIRRVEYDREKELKALADSRLPYANWIARTLQAATPQMP